MSIELLEMDAMSIMEERLQGRRSGVHDGCSGEHLGSSLSQAIRNFYICPQKFFDFVLQSNESSNEGYFLFGSGVTCYGRSCSGRRESSVQSPLYDTLADAIVSDGFLRLPFDPTAIIDNLRQERYSRSFLSQQQDMLKRAYYRIRPLTNQLIRRLIQRFHARDWQKTLFPRWPVDTTVEDLCEKILMLSLQAKCINRVPFVWFWPGGALGCVMITHDVETEAGRDFCPELMDLDDRYGIKASFQIIPEARYAISTSFLDSIRDRGFEIGIHDLQHDGQLFDNKHEFRRRARRINYYGRKYGAQGFRAGGLYRKPEWYSAFDFSFDMSIPNVAHLDPQRGGCCTVMPYFIGDVVELPVTAVQDYTLFYILKKQATDIWEHQIALITRKNGLISFIIHPDYIIEAGPRRVYEQLLCHLREIREKQNIWFALPSEVDSWWRERSKMSVVFDGGRWRIEGDKTGRAVLAFARNENGRLVYELTCAREASSS